MIKDQRPKTKDQRPIDWQNVKRVLVVRLRSIGDTVLATPSLIALKRFLPEAQIDILLEDWVAPVLDGFDAVDNILTVSRKSKKSRIETALQIRRNTDTMSPLIYTAERRRHFSSAPAAQNIASDIPNININFSIIICFLRPPISGSKNPFIPPNINSRF